MIGNCPHTFIDRSALVAWGHPVPNNLASVEVSHEGRHVVTWDEVMIRRRKEQARRLELKRRVHGFRACRVWVAYFDQRLMGGWHAFIEDFRGDVDRTWIDRDRKWLMEPLMELFPASPSLFQDRPDGRFSPVGWEDWKIDFARRFQRGTQHRKPRGVRMLWFDGRDLRLENPPVVGI